MSVNTNLYIFIAWPNSHFNFKILFLDILRGADELKEHKPETDRLVFEFDLLKLVI